MKDLLTPKEVADLLRVPLSWVYSHVGELPHLKFGRLLRFRSEEVEKWMENQHRNGAKTPGHQPGGEKQNTRIQ